ncbi:MAG: hypothetical protein EBV70_03080, partial [Actinobacteria bacterium]|nr:hypothetical protein [Actinomycetota bacterium]
CTGSQGEPLAALSRMANGDHQIRVGRDDTVILASSLIPGNENSVYRVINELTRFGARVVHKGNALVHVSGHAAAGELLYCYNVVKAEDLELFNEVKGRIERALTGAVAGGINGTHQLSQVVRKTVGSWVGEEHRRRPMIVPVVIEV